MGCFRVSKLITRRSTKLLVPVMWRPRRLIPSVIHADSDILVVDKPAGAAAVPGRGSRNLVELLKAHRLVEAGEELRIVHRLDRGASGVMVLARTLEAQRFLHEEWAARRVEKVYLALVTGHVAGEARTSPDGASVDREIDAPLWIDRERRMVKVDRKRGKPSLTRFRVVEHLAGHTLVECRPVTGRLHQIRVHLASIGHPLAVDPLYGGAEAVYLSQHKSDYRASRSHDERPLIDRLTLHALRLTFAHPNGSGRVTFEAPIPKDLRETANPLGRARR